MRPIKDVIEEKLPWLFSELGFRIVSYSVDRRDTSTVVLESDGFRLPFRRELGMVDAQVAADDTRHSEGRFTKEALSAAGPL
ncbi:MAG TPA: hypothetical protein VMH05_01970 [Bryobacteraceae bacterium]|nr:hypothetical protein [Bryobacteraceae bacterium]